MNDSREGKHRAGRGGPGAGGSAAQPEAGGEVTYAVIDEAIVRVGDDLWHVEVLRIAHEHHWRIEKNDELLAEAIGARPEGWPAGELPTEVLVALNRIANELSWS